MSKDYEKHPALSKAFRSFRNLYFRKIAKLSALCYLSFSFSVSRAIQMPTNHFEKTALAIFPLLLCFRNVFEIPKFTEVLNIGFICLKTVKFTFTLG